MWEEDDWSPVKIVGQMLDSLIIRGRGKSRKNQVKSFEWF